MNKTEEYLDALLNNVSPERKAEREQSRRRTSEDFIKDFESELGEEDLDDVFSDFEDDKDSSLNVKKTDDSFFDNLEGIVNTAKGAVAEPEPKEQMGDPMEINTLEDDSWTKPQAQKKPEPSRKEPEPSQEEQDLDEILASIPSKEDILSLSEDSTIIQDDEDDIPEENAAPEKDSTPKKDAIPKEDAFEEKEDKDSDQKKKGFFAKLSEVLFGKNDEDDLTEDEEKSKEEKSDSPKKEKKKKEKKPKKPKKPKKAKKEKKPKKPKKPKEKKPKKPKEVDLSPPLPKVPVVLIFVMSFSVMLFVILSSNLLGYNTSIKDAKAAYYSYDYVGAYENIAGLSPKEKDVEFADQVRLLALVQEKIVNGDVLYRSGKYTMALDSYICALGRYDVHYSEASAYEITPEYENLEKQIVVQLQEAFGVTADTARELYGLRDRTEYTCRVYQLVKNAGVIE